MVSQVAFTGLLALVACQRLFEVRRSRRHEAALRQAGAREHAAWQMPVMAALHSLWLVGAGIEVWWSDREPDPRVVVLAMGLFACGQALRLAAMRALGTRWTVRVITLPGTPPVVGGIYRYLRHPNYLGVALEIAGLPLVHGAIWTATIATIANSLLLLARMRAEERALVEDNDYGRYFGGTRPVRVPRSPSVRR
jgi:methyltransferase